MIDLLEYTKKLEEAGFDRHQAELFVRGQVSMITDNVSTKADLEKISTEFRSELNEMVTTLRSEMKELGTELRSEMNEKFAKMETSIVVKIYIMMGIQLTTLAAIAKLF